MSVLERLRTATFEGRKRHEEALKERQKKEEDAYNAVADHYFPFVINYCLEIGRCTGSNSASTNLGLDFFNNNSNGAGVILNKDNVKWDIEIFRQKLIEKLKNNKLEVHKEEGKDAYQIVWPLG